MRDAQKSLQEGDGEKGKKHQDTAQRALEMAQGNKDQEGEKQKGDKEAPTPAPSAARPISPARANTRARRPSASA